jgi:hypothetical protein
MGMILTAGSSTLLAQGERFHPRIAKAIAALKDAKR